jgi:hypothetical protein
MIRSVLCLCAAFSLQAATPIGKTYEISGWVRTEDLTVKDLDRSPIPSGAALTMASMPYDVHSVSLGGTRDWTRLSLRFVATRAQDQILMTAGSGGAFKGKAWFEGVSLDEASPADSWPAREAVRPSARRIAIPRPAGSICTSKASLTIAAISTDI